MDSCCLIDIKALTASPVSGPLFGLPPRIPEVRAGVVFGPLEATGTVFQESPNGALSRSETQAISQGRCSNCGHPQAHRSSSAQCTRHARIPWSPAKGLRHSSHREAEAQVPLQRAGETVPSIRERTQSTQGQPGGIAPVARPTGQCRSPSRFRSNDLGGKADGFMDMFSTGRGPTSRHRRQAW